MRWRRKGWSKAELLGDALIGGLPGQLTIELDGMLQTMAVQVDGGRISALYVTRNSDKLGHLGRGTTASGA